MRYHQEMVVVCTDSDGCSAATLIGDNARTIGFRRPVLAGLHRSLCMITLDDRHPREH